jgi:hypothetical protein
VCGGHGIALGCLFYDTAMFWVDRGFIAICDVLWFVAICGLWRFVNSGLAAGLAETMELDLKGARHGGVMVKLLGLLSLGLLGWVPAAIAGPEQSRSGLCYLFRNESLVGTQSCGIVVGDRLYSTGYGPELRSLVLSWPDGGRTTIAPTSAFVYPPGLSVDGEPSVSYQRGGVFLQPIVAPFLGIGLDDRIFCERVLRTNDSVCYRFLN